MEQVRNARNRNRHEVRQEHVKRDRLTNKMVHSFHFLHLIKITPQYLENSHTRATKYQSFHVCLLLWEITECLNSAVFIAYSLISCFILGACSVSSPRICWICWIIILCHLCYTFLLSNCTKMSCLSYKGAEPLPSIPSDHKNIAFFSLLYLCYPWLSDLQINFHC